MTFGELAEQYLRDNPEGVWVNFSEYGDYPEQYLDEYYLTEFEGYLNKEVRDYYVDECGYDLLEVFFKED